MKDVKFVTEPLTGRQLVLARLKSVRLDRLRSAQRRERESERGPFAVEAIVNFDRAAMDVDDALDDGKSETRTRSFGAERTIEAVENALTLFGGDAGAVVADFYDGKPVAREAAQFYAAAFWRVANGVVGKVRNHKPNGVFHAVELRGLRVVRN